MGRENETGDPWTLKQEPTLLDLFRTLERKLKLSMRTHVPASIVSYIPATNRAVVLVNILQVVKVADITKLPKRIGGPIKGVPPNAEAPLAPLQLVNIPVAWPRTNAGRITFPLTAGDTGELHVSDRSIEQWILAGIPTDPILTFTHCLKDSVFHPGLQPDTNPIVPPPSSTDTEIEGLTGIKLGALAVDFASKGTTLNAAIDAALAAALLAVVPNDGGLAAITAFQMSWNAAKAGTLSVKVKVE